MRWLTLLLDKTGGLTEALALANEHVHKVLSDAGCMLCTSRAISAAYRWCRRSVSPILMDRRLKLAVDVETGASVHDGRIASLGCQRSKFAIAKRYFSPPVGGDGRNSAVMRNASSDLHTNYRKSQVFHNRRWLPERQFSLASHSPNSLCLGSSIQASGSWNETTQSG